MFQLLLCYSSVLHKPEIDSNVQTQSTAQTIEKTTMLPINLEYKLAGSSDEQAEQKADAPASSTVANGGSALSSSSIIIICSACGAAVVILTLVIILIIKWYNSSPTTEQENPTEDIVNKDKNEQAEENQDAHKDNDFSSFNDEDEDSYHFIQPAL